MFKSAALLFVLLTQPVKPHWLGPSNNVLPFTTDQDAENFLRAAKVIEAKEISGSQNRPQRLLLSANGIKAHAIFRRVDKRGRRARVGDMRIRSYHDSYIYECAAYQLSRLLGIDRVPPCIIRTIKGQKGSVQLWIEQAVSEFQNRYDRPGPKANERWPNIFNTMYVFDSLIHNFDRHAGNILVDSLDRIWFIDHTRSFRLYTNAPLEKVPSCAPELQKTLEDLEQDDLKILKPYLNVRHIAALWRRRTQLIKHLGCQPNEFTSLQPPKPS